MGSTSSGHALFVDPLICPILLTPSTEMVIVD